MQIHTCVLSYLRAEMGVWLVTLHAVLSVRKAALPLKRLKGCAADLTQETLFWCVQNASRCTGNVVILFWTVLGSCIHALNQHAVQLSRYAESFFN